MFRKSNGDPSPASEDRTEHTTASPLPNSCGSEPSEYPREANTKPYDDREIRRMAGFDPDDPNVKVMQVPASGLAELLAGLTGADLRHPIGPNGEGSLLGTILADVAVEVEKAVKKHGPMTTPHEGHSVIEEEFDELWDEIKADRGRMLSARNEAIQVAAMAVRYILDLDPH